MLRRQYVINDMAKINGAAPPGAIRVKGGTRGVVYGNHTTGLPTDVRRPGGTLRIPS